MQPVLLTQAYPVDCSCIATGVHGRKTICTRLKSCKFCESRFERPPDDFFLNPAFGQRSFPMLICRRTAQYKEVRTAYLRLALCLHPDKATASHAIAQQDNQVMSVAELSQCGRYKTVRHRERSPTSLSDATRDVSSKQGS